MKPIVDSLSPATPLATRLRALSYWASEFAYAERYDEANSILDSLADEVKKSHDANLQAELLANRIDLLVIADKVDEAFVKVPDLEAIMPKVTSPRINYYAYNLLSSLYTQWSRYEVALAYLN